MSDPVGLVSGLNGGTAGNPLPKGSDPVAQGPGFKDVLMENLKRANELERDATRAIEDLMAGRRGDIEGVAAATAKADTAFRALQAVRNKVLEAFEEVKQMRA